jgi:DNA-binding transcriptional LysR family regulator
MRFDDLAAFATVVREGSFTRAAARQGVSQSAMSQTVRSLERRLDLRLLNRTTRSLSTTEAGERLYRVVDRRFADIEAELDVLAGMRGKPAGTVRITATAHAAKAIVWPRLASWLPRYPDIRIEIDSSNRFTDIVAERFDIGVRLGADVAKDMIAVRISPDMRMAVVGSPAYLDAHGRPRTPAELIDHDCIGLRLPTHGGLLNWEFRRRGKTATTHVSGRIVLNASDLILAAAEAGLGLAWLPDDLVADRLASGELVSVLDDWAATYPGYHLYYATRDASQATSLVVDALRHSAD